MQTKTPQKDENDIYLSVPELNGNELDYIKEVIQSTWISTKSPHVKKFEMKFAEYLGVNTAAATINGTAALHLALKLLDVREGDEVLVPSMTFVATVSPVLYCRAVPVFVDSDWTTWGMDPDKIRSRITPKTKAIMVTHLYGHPARIDSIVSIAREYNLKVIEDSSHALGSKAYGKFCGTFGDIGCFSFNANKILTTGGGGMIVSNDTELIKRAHFLINQAKEDGKEYFHSEVGFNYRLVGVLAAIGLAQLERLDEFIRKKRFIFRKYKEFMQAPDLDIVFAPEEQWAYINVWMSSILLHNMKIRKDLSSYLHEHRVQVRPFFIPIHTLPPYTRFLHEDIHISEELYQRGINLPCSVGLTEEQIRYVADLIVDFCRKHKD